LKLYFLQKKRSEISRFLAVPCGAFGSSEIPERQNKLFARATRKGSIYTTAGFIPLIRNKPCGNKLPQGINKKSFNQKTLC
jgi:hypothetical protein